ncbi:MAG: (d)CMP kinase [Alphaproteobacteria bacterium]
MTSTVIAIDGPAAAGKGTLAKQLAAHFDFAHLDTGALYRATAFEALAAGLNPESPDFDAAATDCAKTLNAVILNDPAIRRDDVGQMASKVAVIPGVRAALLDFQRQFASHPPSGKAGAVLDGRDVGTVICPQADLKLFITASDAARARRRYEELVARGDTGADYGQVLADLIARDKRDSERAAAPLSQAADAVLLDTTELDIEAALKAALKICAARLGQ